MEIRQPIHSEHAKRLDTEGLRKEFLIENLFCEGEMNLTYSPYRSDYCWGSCPNNSTFSINGG
ncbi:5-keto-4-deoxyuronate isomerase [Proteus mirabilis]|uniref:5-keto-4-deoxyuronate isomerase n=1 Tax=Proteus mirabilis TaxID=584 RepID=A0A2X2DDR8_PROMI|nr:5-keto-4-deoxyuronate isomerase [Proteus mirabilis]